MARTRSCQKFEYDIDEFRLYVANHTSAEAAEFYGVSTRTITSHASSLGLKCRDESRSKEHDEAVARVNGLLSNAGSSVRYFAGTTKRNDVTFKCEKCGNVFKRQIRNVMKGRTWCPRCRRDERDAALKAEAEEKKKELAAPIRCAECGKEFAQNVGDDGVRHKTPKYCSKRCRRRACHRASEHRRRALVKTAGTYSWQGIYEKTDGKCWICGEMVDESDFKVVGGSFVAGPRYPSVDHVVPLSKGGTSEPGNMLLAHCICNSLRGVG